MVDLLVFVPACFALNLAFGPNNLMSVTNGAHKGLWFAGSSGIGRIVVFAPMIVLSALGLGVLLSTSAVVFNVLKVIGALYLVWLGIKQIRSANRKLSAAGALDGPTWKQAVRNEAVVAASNPKAILIFAAFFPQFVDPTNYWGSYAVIAMVFLALEVVTIFLYSAVGRFARLFAARRMHWIQRGSGAGMIAFGVLLLAVRQPARV